MRSSTVRRSAEEWAALVAEWEESGQDSRTFAAARHINPRTFSWWRWRLGKGTSAGPTADGLRLVKVDVEPEPMGEPAPGVGPKVSWEIATRCGVLRVHEGIDGAALAAVLAALVDRGAAS
ncbi:MAG TPA: hypothetical protein VMP89_17595 [Solirubrobacteraceae bacterium]|nr:hypothetical protein [Solirubrobacteraceae bacterium]